ncbi:hypothetical protein [Nocardioides stalactiti]|uniref:hypothetical protein n=1 Tax=Nocardioides stalactiti TaxID=2755356 RepID=UPI0015FF8BE6|nr:hypothetical protein [Nocardioides stalactiti]
MPRNRSPRRAHLVLTTLAASALLAGCGDDGGDEADDVETVIVTASVPTDVSTEVPTDATTDVTTDEGSPDPSDDPFADYVGRDCLIVPPAGSLTPPEAETSYDAGTAGFAIELSDGSTNCLTFSVDGEEVGTWEPGELAVEIGEETQGFTLTLTDYSEDGVDDISAGEGDPFIGLQYEGNYFADSLHTGCTTVLLDVTPTSSAGTFTCAAIESFAGGPWNGDSTDLTVVSAVGHWNITTG